MTWEESITRALMPDGSPPFRFATRISGNATLYSVLWVSIMPSKGNGKR